jgi:hypothetical protein
MSATPLVRAIRKPLIWLIVVAATLLTLLVMETSGTRHAPSLVPLTAVANQGNSNTHSNGSTAHCTDGHGQDGTHNPHCRGISHN